MAKKDDTINSLVAGGTSFPLPPLPPEGSVSSEHIVSYSMSEDGRYMRQVIVRITDVQALNSLAQQSQYRQQAQFIRSLFSQYIDFNKHEAFCGQLVQQINAGNIEWQTDLQGNCYVNITKGSGLSDFFRLLLDHMAPRKRKTLHDKEGFKAFKKALRMNVRQHGQVLNNNSLGITLHRLIDKT
jgi:hypothetical protein